MAGIAALVNDAPPGEIDAVRRDIEILSGGSSAVSRQLEEETAKANIEQLRVVEVDGLLTVVSKYNKIDETTFFTHGSKPKKFSIEHDTRKTAVEGPHTLPKDVANVQTEIDSYVSQHYAGESVAAAFPVEGESNKTAIVVIGRKLSPQNFHNGQLTAQYVLDGENLKGEIRADVHYFEEGNVRLRSAKIVNTEVASVSALATVLARVESEFESSLNKTLVNLNEREFKALRRQLPVTRQPMVWGKAVAGYKLGKELENR